MPKKNHKSTKKAPRNNQKKIKKGEKTLKKDLKGEKTQASILKSLPYRLECSYDKLVHIDSLHLNPDNPNKHPETQVIYYALILTDNGVRRPVRVSKRTGLISAGHGQILAFKLNGWDYIPVDYQDYENSEDEWNDIVADNALAQLAELDLGKINEVIVDMGPDYDVSKMGLPNFKVEPADKQSKDTEGEDNVPEKAKKRTKSGQLWQLGDHRLLCGDATKDVDIQKLTDGEKIKLLLTDPPYGMSVVKADGSNIEGKRKGSVVGKSKLHKAKVGVYRPVIGDDKPFDPSPLLSLCQLQIIFGANHFSEKLPTSPHWIVWYKDMPEGTDFSGAELAWTNIKKKAVKTYKFTWAGMTREGNRKDELVKRVHPTQKPVGLFEKILNDYDAKSVMDVYGGSGSTLIACEKTDRKCFMMEIDPLYCDVILERWEKYTDKKAIKLS